MSKFLVSYVKPEKYCKTIVVTATPEEAALHVHAQCGTEPTSMTVEPLDGVDSEDERVVYQWCTVCGLPIWISDDVDTYTVHYLEDRSDSAVSHGACLKGEPHEKRNTV